jgi:uncharacterized RDD family membrane protein YckC
MNESIVEYKKRLAEFGNEDVESILRSMDKEKHPERYSAVLEEVVRRKAEGRWESVEPLGPHKYHTMWRRVGAQIVDGLLFLAIMWFIVSPFDVLQQMKEMDRFREQMIPHLLKAAALQLSFMLYVILMHWKFGATLGKMAMNLKVVDHGTEGAINLWQSTVREIVPLIVVLISFVELFVFKSISFTLSNFADNVNSWWALIEIGTALFNPKRRALHDFMAKTIVVRV